MELELKVEGMVCDGCSTRVADALKVSTSQTTQQHLGPVFNLGHCVV